MYNSYSSYYITFIILSLLFIQYHTLESNVENYDSAPLDLIQNDLSSINFLNQKSLVHSISGNSENKYLRKRQTDEKEIQKRNVVKIMSKTKVLTKKPSSGKLTTKKPTTKYDKYAKEKTKLYSKINSVRKMHQASSLTVDSRLAEKAQKLTSDSAKKKQVINYSSSKYGLLLHYYEKDGAHYAVSQWTEGSNNFNFEDPEHFMNYDDFTQLIWVSSKKIGCGYSRSSDKITVIACLIYPKGNIKGKYRKNVLKKKQ